MHELRGQRHQYWLIIQRAGIKGIPNRDAALKSDQRNQFVHRHLNQSTPV